MAFLAAHLLSLVGFIMAILLVARGQEQRRPAGSLFAWLFAILLVPYLGVPLYLLFGGRKIKARAAQKQRIRAVSVPSVGSAGRLATMLSASGAAPPTGDNEITLLSSGEAAFSSVLEQLASAQRSIEISTLILADDATGRAIGAALIERARAGVQVRVLIDAMFKFRASKALIRELRAAGVQVAWFMPIWSLMPRRSANLRLHRKLIVIDADRAIIGGMNLALEYMGAEPLPGRWRDLSVLVRGPAARDIERVFAGDWEFAAGEPVQERPEALAGPVQTAAPGSTSGASVQVVGSGPDAESDRIYDALISAAFDARERLWIATPYFVPDEALLRALVLAVRRGVDVRVVVPKRSNHLTADLAGASYLRALAREGGRVRCYTREMLHAKLALFDAELAMLGSANMDMRSLFLDYEIALVITSADCAAALQAWFTRLFEESAELEPATRTRAIIEPVARLIAPLE
ncbi:MAG TPA: phospholipase D-like domain-containing protein [Polyangiaceae bacterium]|nr:phospholipase D-like domain-containing protein [Polyangiaceae bacterium]